MKDKGRILILLFISSEAFFFIALIIAYVFYRNFSHATDTVAKHLEAGRATLFTLCLVASSGTLILSKRALRKGSEGGYKIWLALTILLGIVFMVGQITEYTGLYQEQVKMSTNVFGSSFFTLTGFHGLHVILGLIALSVLLVLSMGKLKDTGRSALGGVDVYWHFVDVVWLFVLTFVYYIPLL